MNVFPYSMEEALRYKRGDYPPATNVFSGRNLSFVARVGVFDAFDIRFPLDLPFVYDRRKGQLVLTAFANSQDSNS